MWFLFAVLFLLDATIHDSKSARFTIMPSPDSPCPGEFTGEPCLTLEQYVANPSLTTDTIIFELHPGSHQLVSQLSVSNINSLTMRANSSVSVTCRQQVITNGNFYFSHLQQVHVSGITFVGCRMRLGYVTNATLERSSFVNRSLCCNNGAALYVSYSSVLIGQCNISNNSILQGAIYGYRSNFTIERTAFSDNHQRGCCRTNFGGAIYQYGGNMDILNCKFNRHSALSFGNGGAIYIEFYRPSAVVTIVNSYFSDNRAGKNSGHGGVIYVGSSTMVNINIVSSYFSDNRAGSNAGHGGAIYFNGGNITVINSTFINNTASSEGGGAIFSARRYTNVSLINNIFSYNSAAYCGAIDVDEFYHENVFIVGNTFIYNRAVGLTGGNNGGGVICIINASMTISGNNFSHNSAVGNAGVIRVDKSYVVIKKSIFNNNTAGGNGGALHTYFYPTRYAIINSSFSNNRAGGDGGVMYVGRAGSHVTINQSTFRHNHAHERGGVVAIFGSTLQIDGINSFENNTGKIVSACTSNVTFTNARANFTALQDPLVPLCTLYGRFNLTALPTRAPSIVTESTTGSQTETRTIIFTTTTLASTTSTGDKHKPSTISPSEETTQNGDISPTTQTSAPTTAKDHPYTVSTKGSAFTLTSNPTSEAVTATKDNSNSVDTTHESMVTTDDNGTIATSPTTIPERHTATGSDTSTTNASLSESTTITPISEHTASQVTESDGLTDNIPTIVVQASADSGKINLHFIIPGYASLGLSVVLFIFIVLVIAVKVVRKKPRPPTRSRKSEYTLIEVQAKE